MKEVWLQSNYHISVYDVPTKRDVTHTPQNGVLTFCLSMSGETLESMQAGWQVARSLAFHPSVRPRPSIDSASS